MMWARRRIGSCPSRVASTVACASPPSGSAPWPEGQKWVAIGGWEEGLTGRSAQIAEELPDLVGQRAGILESGEVPAVVDHRPAAYVVVRFGQFTGCAVHLPERRHAEGHLDPGRLRDEVQRREGLVVHPHRRA